ncbi:MAG: hypothetical protein ABFD08_10135 [Syntrophomonas sp.]
MNNLRNLPDVRALFVLIYISMVGLPLTAHAAYSQPLDQAPPEIQQAYLHVSADFELYLRFLDVNETGGEPVLENAHNPREARVFLNRGFSDYLADAIYSNFTRYDKERELLILIPCDGLPMLGLEERDGIQYNLHGQEAVLFQYMFKNCYRPGDAYLYSVTARLNDGWWKIEDLDLREVPDK